VSVMHRLRAYHALLVVLAVAAYASGEMGLIHAWLGYAVALVIVARLVWATTGVPQLGLMRFYPQFAGLKLDNAMTHPAISRALLLAIAAGLIGVTGTGIALDRGRSLKLAAVPVIAEASAETGKEERRKAQSRQEREGDEGPLSEAHELLANLLVGLVGLHVVYLLLFKLPLARFMLFLDTPKR
jgi:cytochrome b